MLIYYVSTTVTHKLIPSSPTALCNGPHDEKGSSNSDNDINSYTCYFDSISCVYYCFLFVISIIIYSNSNSSNSNSNNSSSSSK